MSSVIRRLRPNPFAILRLPLITCAVILALTAMPLGAVDAAAQTGQPHGLRSRVERFSVPIFLPPSGDSDKAEKAACKTQLRILASTIARLWRAFPGVPEDGALLATSC